jgi:glucose-1-phosphate thymidylyltransferase
MGSREKIESDRFWAVVPVAGAGTRLRPHTHTRPKPLLYVAGQPILGHILKQLLDVGIRKIVLVVGDMGEQILGYVREHQGFAVVEGVKQEERLGLGHAILLAREVVQEDPMLVVYGDTIFQADLQAVLGSKTDGMLGVKQVQDPRRFGVVVEEDGQVTRLVEKSETFVSNRAIIGVNLIWKSGLLFECLEKIVREERRTHGEYQLTDGLQQMVERGAVLGTFPVEEWFDCGTLEALLDTNRHLLKKLPGPDNSENTVIIPPVHIAPTACVSCSVIGPYVSIGDGAQVERVIARNLIIGSQAFVKDVSIEDTLIGNQARVIGGTRKLNVGDMSEVTG